MSKRRKKRSNRGFAELLSQSNKFDNDVQLALNSGNLIGYIIVRTDTHEMLASFSEFEDGNLAAWCNFPTNAKRLESLDTCKAEVTRLKTILELPLIVCELIDTPERYLVNKI